ncbi:MAG: translation initiation factor IF-6 [Thermoproteota archaeon]
MRLAIYRYTVYKSPNIGIFVKANDSVLVMPHGFADTKGDKLAEYLEVGKIVQASVAGTRLLGPMTAMNNNGILLPPITEDEEVRWLRQNTSLNVERLENTRMTAIGNLVAANDRGAVLSSAIKDSAQQVRDVLGVPEAQVMDVGGYVQTGAMVVATNSGAGVHPGASEDEVKAVSEILKVPSEPLTVNGGVPFLSSGIVANTKNVVVGSLTSGPELIMLSRIYQA